MNQCNDPDHGAINAERAESRGLRKAWVELDDKRQDLEKQLTAVTKQRDTLAEALKTADVCLALFEDTAHGELGEMTTKTRKIIATLKL
jgi:ABC-type methionine transport system ATPase subunit